MIARSASGGGDPTSALPLMNSVGVPVTPSAAASLASLSDNAGVAVFVKGSRERLEIQADGLSVIEQVAARAVLGVLGKEAICEFPELPLSARLFRGLGDRFHQRAEGKVTKNDS